jgi:hypothetical protein
MYSSMPLRAQNWPKSVTLEPSISQKLHSLGQTGEDSLFLGGLGEGSIVGLGERANLTLLAVLFIT